MTLEAKSEQLELPPSPEREKKGILKIGISSSCLLFHDIEEFFRIVDEINQEREDNLSVMLYLDRRMTVEKIKTLLDKYGDVEITSIHLPFNYDLPHAVHRVLLGEGSSFRYRLEQVSLTALLGFAGNERMLKIAEVIKEKMKEKEVTTSLVLHPEIVVGFAHAGRLERIGEDFGIHVDAERPYDASPTKSLAGTLGKPNLELISDPETIDNRIRKRYLPNAERHGIVLDVDHRMGRGDTPQEILEELRKIIQNKIPIKSIQLSGSNHSPDLKGLTEILRGINQEVESGNLTEEVNLYLDLNPFFILKAITHEKKVQMIKGLIGEMESI